ncbi:dynein intermediate chain 3, ciliary, putative [Pediculus humanus corporis]|uniref:Dynein intermediate chain 3, ciliary, putative n=1 Tax=Pediculus humanus subsp. corporis TaxID=121224 RepID=E0W011_PEDHC|nr:dynein intermediate chain 3, ciliary, putative [Pediculus humanus corporis]EEB18967.1 dynein intermediate chain 3, ciliary, putative [Pediculus humanus corporis]
MVPSGSKITLTHDLIIFSIDYRYLKTFHHSRNQNGEHLTSSTTQLTLNVMETHVGPSGFVELTCISTIPAYLDDEEERFADKRIQTISGEKNFGRQCVFCDEGPKLIDDLKPDKAYMEKYIFKNPVEKGTQYAKIMSENQINTIRKDFADHGMNHLEGGWPKELDTNDEEAVLRFRKKIERLDNYILAMKHLTAPMEHAILQNNAVNIYEQYFVNTVSAISSEKASCRIQNVFRDPQEVKRPITHCSWSPIENEFALTHCNMNFQRLLPDQTFKSYIWDVENSNTPLLHFEAKMPIVSLEFNPKDAHSLAGGMYSGQVAGFDSRKGPEPVVLSCKESSHRDPAHSVLWISTKSGMEFFSTSSDGTVKWWDCRKLDNPVDFIILDTSKGEKPSFTRAMAASCLEYEPNIPARYMVGSENGYIIAGNRKGTNQQEKLPWMMKAHYGPIYTIHRNQAFNKNVLTVGDWSARIFSEDCKESAILWTKYHNTRLTAGEWSQTRASVFFLTREDGVLDLWDILQEQKHAYLSFKLSDQPLTCLRVRDDGELVVVGNAVGTAFVVRYSTNLAETSKNDKNFLGAMFDRESRREKLLETRNKEIRFRMREIALAKEMKEDKSEPVKTDFEIAVQNLKEKLETDLLNAFNDVKQEEQKLETGGDVEEAEEDEEDEDEIDEN